ncbi:chemotaxis protein CheA [uncultured Tateyamaria sp.]|uniref:chemotaxis protein CheA n=1 Tax=uncultured Tateyamaria sp. TaxID=455651 RepID=UPI00260CD24A|nr:chemotaxis protein CheA [uncultured Tateyamaria sp.]
MTKPDPMEEIRASFFIECEELLEATQDGLQQLDEGCADSETIHVVFRAVHSIKGGAGAFGLKSLVRFAHTYETTLEAVRNGSLEADPPLINLFFRATDHLSDLVRASRDNEDVPAENGEKLLQELEQYIGGGEEDEDEPEPDIDFQPLGLSLDLDLGEAEEETQTTPRFEVKFSPEAEMFEGGNDAYPILGAIAGLGEARVQCDMSRLPDLKNLAPETPYLSWVVELTADVDEAEIASMFEFVEGLCAYSITRLDGANEATAQDAPVVLDLPMDLPPLPTPETDEPAMSIEPEPEEAAAPAPPPEPDVPAPSAKEARPTERAATSGQTAPKSVVRVDLDRIERLVNLVGELVINQAMLAQSLKSSGLSPHSDAMNGLEEFQRLTRDIQDSVMMIRAQPVKSLFQRMSRIVREASAAVDKDVRLVCEGENTEVDKTVIERLADPLTHMIRNAVDHGLESTADRVAAGKSPGGIVRLSAAHRSGRVVIDVSDDGAGINRPRVQQIATEKGLIAPDAVLSDSEIDNLLFLPGFSTASTVSDLSGRGVGMDVVRTSIQALGGRISITSVPTKGTVFSISLPLTLAVLDGMVVDVAGETLVIPLNMVAETMTLTEETLNTIQPGVDVVRVRTGFVPLFDLGHLLGYRDKQDSYVESVALLISHEDGSLGALIVDDIQDQRQVVIKGLDDTFYRAPGIAAATILGDGQIALILDPSDIISKAHDVNATAPLKLEA